MKRPLVLLSCVLIATLAFPALAHAFGDEVVVGFLVPLTKKGASYGVQSRAATEVAVEEINGAGGINGRKLRMITKDTEDDNALAIHLPRGRIDKDQVLPAPGPRGGAEAGPGFPTGGRRKVLGSRRP